jgi:ABC-type nitrate/sulfonate/bicarbonate transport system permease component
MSSAVKRLGFFVGLPVLLVLGWWAVTARGASFFVPDPLGVAQKFVAIWFQERFFTDVVPSVLRLVAGLAISIVLGISLGVLIGSVRWVRWLLEPTLEFVRAIPATILIPVLLLVIGINDAMKVTVIVLGCLWPILLNTVAGVSSIDEVQLATARVYKLRGWDRLRYLVLPAASPQMMAGIRQSLAVGLILMVVSEMFAATEGIGYATINFQNRIAIPEMWSGILLLGILGVLLSMAFTWCQKNILGWYEGLKESADD